MSENRPGDDPRPADGPDAPAPNPFSRAGADPDPRYDPSAYPPAPYNPGVPAPSPPPNPGWPSYPASATDATYPPPGQAPAPGFDPQPTPPYGPVDAALGYGDASANGAGPQAYGVNPYEPAPNPYQPSYGGYAPYGVVPAAHPKSTPALIFGILGLVLGLSCGVGGLLGIGGIVNGRVARREIDADPQRYTGRSMANAGFGLGIAGVVIAALVTVGLVVLLGTGAFNS